MSYNNTFELLTKTPMIKKVIIAFIAILILSTNGISSMVSAIPDYLDKGLNPIPYSPPMPEGVKRMNERKVKIDKGTKIIIDGAIRYVTPHSKDIKIYNSVNPTSKTKTLTTVRARINEYAAVRNYTLNTLDQIINEGLGFKIINDSQQGTTTHSLLMYPQVRDIIPPSAEITEAVIITSYYQPGLLFNIEISEITSIWDPRNPITTLPSFSNPIGTSSWDMSSTTVTGRTIDVTSVVQSWFSGTTNQWGFKISQITQNVLFQPLNPPRLYITYMMPEGSFSAATISGGTIYNDNVCPGMWIPRRATYIYKTGILENLVQTQVLAGTMMDPPEGYDNQSVRWVMQGKPVDPNVNCTAGLFSIQAHSEACMNDVLRNILPVDCEPFPPDILDQSITVYPVSNNNEDVLPKMQGGDAIIDPDPPFPDDDGDFRSKFAHTHVCQKYKEWQIDAIGDCPPETPQPPPPIPPPADSIDAWLPPINPPLEIMRNSWEWTDLPNQVLSFNRYEDGTLTVIDANQTGWFSKWKAAKNTARMAVDGNTKSSFGSELGWEVSNAINVSDPIIINNNDNKENISPQRADGKCFRERRLHEKNKWVFVLLVAIGNLGTMSNSNLTDG